MIESPSQTIPPSTAEAVFAEVEKRLNAIPSLFVKPRFLFEVGLFGSPQAASLAVQAGAIPHIKISPYRVLVAKSDVLTFLREKYSA